MSRLPMPPRSFASAGATIPHRSRLFAGLRRYGRFPRRRTAEAAYYAELMPIHYRVRAACAMPIIRAEIAMASKGSPTGSHGPDAVDARTARF